MLEGREVIIELLHRDFGINLGGGDVRMAKNPTDALDGYPLVECQHGKTMSGAMQSDMFVESTFVHHPMNPFGHRAVFHRGENGLSILMVFSDDFQWDVKQLYLEGYLGLMPFGDDPGSTVDGDDIRRLEFFHVDEGQSGERCKYKDVAREVEGGFLEVMVHQLGYLFFRQIFPWSDILGDMELAEGIPFDKSSGMGSGDHPLEQLASQPDSTAVQASVGTEVSAEVVDELGHELRQLDVADLHPVLEESGRILPPLLHGPK